MTGGESFLLEVRIALGPGPLSADLPGPLLGGGVTPLLQPGVAHCLDLLPVLHLLDWLQSQHYNILGYPWVYILPNARMGGVRHYML